MSCQTNTSRDRRGQGAKELVYGGNPIATASENEKKIPRIRIEAGITLEMVIIKV